MVKGAFELIKVDDSVSRKNNFEHKSLELGLKGRKSGKRAKREGGGRSIF
jgi:hypothetical protein